MPTWFLVPIQGLKLPTLGKKSKDDQAVLRTGSTPSPFSHLQVKAELYSQRVFNVLKRTRLSRRRIIWLLTPSLPPSSPVSKLSLSIFLYITAVELKGTVA
jgi:hypothetical protein